MVRSTQTRALAWAAWDWALQPFFTVITTFVFAVYLTSDLFLSDTDAALPAGSPEYDAAYGALSSALGGALAVAAVVVAVAAPVVGLRSDALARRKVMLAVTTAVVVVMTAAMFFVRPEPGFFVVGVVLLAIGTVFAELSYVPYNALLVEVSTTRNRARVGSLGYGLGYLGGILVMIVVYVGFIAGEPYWFGVSEAESENIRAITLVCAAWILVFSVPLFLAVPEPARAASPEVRLGVLDIYRHVFATIRRLVTEDRQAFRFLLASAVFRDGLSGVFVFGGVLAAVTFGFSFTEVTIFGILASLGAGLSTIASGWIEQRVGSRRLILFALPLIIVTLTVMFLARDAGPATFWICGLITTLFSNHHDDAGADRLRRRVLRPLHDDRPRGELHHAGALVSLHPRRRRSVLGRTRNHPGARRRPRPLPAGSDQSGMNCAARSAREMIIWRETGPRGRILMRTGATISTN
jgi:UMF1 family MFS transporter